MRKEGFTTAIAATGQDALAEFDRNGADIVLLDLMLPGMSGTDVCKALRTRSAVPVIMVTARDSEIDKVVGLELGADDYVTKPYSARELIDWVEIAVTDRGIGIAPEHQKRVFERFFRVDPARSRATGGTGLGLAIVKHVLANHGGEVRLWSRPGTGSTFTMRLPAPADTAPRGIDQVAEAAPVGGTT